MTITPQDVRRITAIRNPILRNLEITHAYSQLAAAVAARGDARGANWCVFATWASRQAGATIRGEDTLDVLTDRLGGGTLLHPARTFGRWLLRRGLFDPASRVGRLMARLHTPFDAIELASDAVARGNRKVFEEIGYEFARWLAAPDPEAFVAELRDGDPPDGQRLLRSAFTRYTADAAPQELLLANLEIGLHEQTRLQPEICEALDSATVTAQELGKRLCPGRRPRIQKAAGLLAAPVQGWLAELSREVITHSLMVISVPGRILLLGSNLDDPYPEALRELSDEELAALVALFEPTTGLDHSGATDWSNLNQRMHYITHLFRAFHEQHILFDAPFTPQQVEQFLAGNVPDGDL